MRWLIQRGLRGGTAALINGQVGPGRLRGNEYGALARRRCLAVGWGPRPGDRNPSPGFTGGFGGGVADRHRGDVGGSYATSGPGIGMGMGSSYYAQGSSNQGFGTAAQSHAGRGSKNYRRSDARIEEEVHELLMRHHGIDATDIDVT